MREFNLIDFFVQWVEHPWPWPNYGHFRDNQYKTSGQVWKQSVEKVASSIANRQHGAIQKACLTLTLRDKGQLNTCQ